MKKTILYAGMIAIVALTACNSVKTEETNAETPSAPSGALTTVDLENRGLDGLQLTISVPDSLSKKMTFAKSEYSGALDILAGDNYQMRIYSNMADEELPIDSSMAPEINTIKYNNDPETNKYYINEPYLIMWSSPNNDGVTCFHFYASFPDPKSKSTFYSFEDNSKIVHSEAAIRNMIAIAKTMKRK